MRHTVSMICQLSCLDCVFSRLTYFFVPSSTVYAQSNLNDHYLSHHSQACRVFLRAFGKAPSSLRFVFASTCQNFLVFVLLYSS